MDAKDIWSGQNYAFVEYISRGVNYYSNAVPVKILRVFKKTPFGAARATTMVEVIMLDNELQPKKRHDGTEYTREVRARNIYARWEEHKIVHDKKVAEREEADRLYEERMRRHREELEARAAREKTEREAREAQERVELEARLAREEAEKNRLLNYLDMKLPRDIVIGVRSTEVILDRAKLEKYLGMRKLEAVSK